MGMASMKNLQILQIRCVPENDKRYQQRESIVSPEAVTLLLNSTSIQSLYLENCGLIDDHMDAIAAELPNNNMLKVLDLKHNLFTDDALYTTGHFLPVCHLNTLDISGITDITEPGGKALAAGMRLNHKIEHFELEGSFARFQDEFHIPVGHSSTEWMKEITYRLRLNRAYQAAAASTAHPALLMLCASRQPAFAKPSFLSRMI